MRHKSVDREVLTPGSTWAPSLARAEVPRTAVGAFQVFSYKEEILILKKGTVTGWEITGQQISSRRWEKKKNSSDQLPHYLSATFP